MVFGLNNMGAIHTRLNRYHEAIASLEASLAENEVMRGEFSDLQEDLIVQEVESVSWLAELLPTLGDYARSLAEVGRTAEARDALARKVDLSERLAREDPDNAIWQERGLLSKVLLATEVFHQGDATAAGRLLDRAEAGFEQLLAEDRNRDPVTLHIAHAASSRAYFALDDPEQALAILKASFDVLEPRLGEPASNPLVLDYYVRAVILEAAALRAAGRQPDRARIGRALTLLAEQGEPQWSVRHAAALGLLELAQAIDDAGTAEFKRLQETGYRSVFFERMRATLES